MDNVKPCEACGQHKKITARGLCRSCYEADLATRRAEAAGQPLKPGPPTTVGARIPCAHAHCGKTMPVGAARRAAAEAGKPIYCSRNCQKAASSVDVECALDSCRAPFRIHRSRYDQATTKRFFCCREHGGQMGQKPRTGRYVPCEFCTTGQVWVIPAEEGRRRFCSPACRNDAQKNGAMVPCAGPDCTEEVWRSPSLIKRGGYSYHSSACEAGHRKEMAEARVRINQDGYALVYRDGKYQLQHRVIAAQVLGRELLANEEVHHLNGNRADNRTDGPFVLDEHGRLKSGNLDVWSTSQPKGQEVGPKLAYAREILALYGEPAERAQYAAQLPEEARG